MEKDEAQNLLGQTLEWVQPELFKSQYSLQHRERSLCTVKIPTFGRSAKIEAASGCWELHSNSMWEFGFVIRACGSTQDIGSFEQDRTRGGQLRAPGAPLKFNADLNGGRFELATQSGVTAMSYRLEGKLFNRRVLFELQQQGAQLADPWLHAGAGFYVVMGILSQQGL